MVSIRPVQLINGYVYHVFNRGVERRPIFTTQREFERFTLLLDYYRFEKTSLSFSVYLTLLLEQRKSYLKTLQHSPQTIEILAYSLLPNHFHLIIKQTADRGISRAISNICNSYAKYFNKKRHRVGPLYQGPFKAVLVETDEQLIHLSRYIHINPVVSAVTTLNKLETYAWSSLSFYLKKIPTSFVKPEMIMAHFSSPSKYWEFIINQVAYAKELEKIKHLTLEEEV